MVGAVIGIDLGTTNSAVGHLDANGRPQVLRNREGQLVTPSVVHFSGGLALVGAMAKRSAAEAALDTVQFVKRHMGEGDWAFTAPDGQVYRPEEVSALLLRRLVEDAEAALGEPVDAAVITVPAYFDDARRRATQHAGEIAGLRVLRVLNEPTAAALAYCVDHQLDGRLLVYDLGGGTFDVTVVDVEQGRRFTVRGTEGDRNLGGFDWDNALMRWVDARFQEAGGPPLLGDVDREAALRDRVEVCKHTLTTMPEATVLLSANGHTERVQVTRAQFDEVTAQLLYRTEVLVEGLLEDLDIDWDDIDHVLLVGGSTRMPQVRERLAMWTSPDKILRSPRVDELVALGAAVQAGLETLNEPGRLAPFARASLQRVTVVDVTSHGLGVLVQDPTTGSRANSVIIPRNSTIPAEATERYATTSEGQTVLHVQVTQGDEEDAEYARVIGTQKVDFPPRPANWPVDISFVYTVDQMVAISVRDGRSGELVGRFAVENQANMDIEVVQQATARLKGIPSV